MIVMDAMPYDGVWLTINETKHSAPTPMPAPLADQIAEDHLRSLRRFRARYRVDGEMPNNLAMACGVLCFLRSYISIACLTTSDCLAPMTSDYAQLLP